MSHLRVWGWAAASACLEGLRPRMPSCASWADLQVRQCPVHLWQGGWAHVHPTELQTWL